MKKIFLTIIMCVVAMFGMAQDKDTAFDLVEESPQYQGGMNEMMSFLTRNLRYPPECQAQKVQGRVLVTFIIDKDGSVVNPKIVKSVHELLDKEAIRVVSMMPKWTPGKNKGEIVRVRFTLPISFRLPTEESVPSATQHVYDIMKENEGMKQNPAGLYRMMMLSYKNGKQPIIPSLEQYKYVSEKGAVIMSVRNNMDHTMLVAMRDDVGHPLLYTGDTPQGADGKDTRVFDSGPSGFKFAWWSQNQSNKLWFPDNEFVYEWYSNKEGLDKVKKAVSVFKNWNVRSKTNPVLGCWHSEGKVKKIGDKEMLVERNEDLYTIYDEDASISLIMMYNDKRKCDYILREARHSKNIIIDGEGKEFRITWESKDYNAMRLSWEENGVTVSEIFVRSELPDVAKIVGESM